MIKPKDLKIHLSLIGLTFSIFCSIIAPILVYAQEWGNFRVYLPIIVKNWPISYAIERVGMEHRFICAGHHFMTLIDDNGTLNLRPHPGVDENGWGSSWYAQPFLPGAVLGHTLIETIEARDGEGIHLVASGNVSRDSSATYGTWSITLNFECNRAEKKILGSGEYVINLESQLTSETGDLNLFKIASNSLDDVPLLSGEIGDTGDMKWVVVAKGDNEEELWFSPWDPPERPAHCPTDETNHLGIEVIGQCNNVDTEAQGYDPIEPAYKPSMKVVLISQQATVGVRFCGMYDLDKSNDFWEDNVGITPIVYRTSPETEFRFDVKFESTALPGDGQPDCLDDR